MRYWLTSSRGYHLVEAIRHRHKYRHEMGSTGGWVWCTEAVMPLAGAPQSLRTDEAKVRVSQIPCQCPRTEPSFSSGTNQEATVMIQGYMEWGLPTSTEKHSTERGN